MIVRIIGQGQFQVDDGQLARLNELDDAVTDAVRAADEQRFARTLAQLIEEVRTVGTPVPADHLGKSDVILPDPVSSLPEVRALLGSEGLVPG